MAQEWFCRVGNSELGPFTAAEMKEMAKNGRLGPTDSVRQGQEGDWAPASRFKGLVFATGGHSQPSVTPTSSSSPSAPPPAPMATQSAIPASPQARDTSKGRERISWPSDPVVWRRIVTGSLVACALVLILVLPFFHRLEGYKSGGETVTDEDANGPLGASSGEIATDNAVNETTMASAASEAKASAGDIAPGTVVTPRPAEEDSSDRVLSAGQALHEAFQVAVTIPAAKGNAPEADMKAKVLSEIARAQAKIGDLEGARRSLKAIPSHTPSTNLFIGLAIAEIAEIQAKHGGFDAATKTANTAPDCCGKCLAMARIAEVRWPIDRSAAEKCFDLAAQVEKARGRDAHVASLEEICRARARCGDDEGAAALAKEVAALVPTYPSHLLMQNIGTGQAMRGDVDLAIKTYTGYSPAGVSDSALLVIVEALVRKHEFARAISFVDSFGPGHLKARALEVIILAQVKAGQKDQAARIMSRLTDACDETPDTYFVFKAQALAGLLVCTAEINDQVDEQNMLWAMELALPLKPECFAESWWRLAQHEARRTGRSSDAAPLFNGAAQRISGLADSNTDDKSTLYRELAFAQASVGCAQDAGQWWLGEVKQPLFRCYALIGIAEGEADYGKHRTTVPIAKSNSDGSDSLGKATPAMRENVADKPKKPVVVVDLAAAMETAGFRLTRKWKSEVEIFQFVRSGRAGQGQPEDVDHQAQVRSRTYALLHRAIFLPERSQFDEKGLFVGAAVGLRLYKSQTLEATGFAKLNLSRVAADDVWFLTKTGTLRKCADATDVALVKQHNGVLYLGESRSTDILMISFSDKNTARRIAEAPSRFSMDVVFDDVKFGDPASDAWGHYRWTALLEHDWDSDYFVQRNLMRTWDDSPQPDYFRVAPPQDVRYVTANLVAAILRDEQGRSVASYRGDGGNRKLLLPTPATPHVAQTRDGQSSPSPAEAKGKENRSLSGIWKSATGAHCRLVDDGAAVTVSLVSRTEALEKLSGKLTRRDGRTEAKYLEGTLNAVFVGSPKPRTLRTIATLEDVDHLTLRFTDWPTHDQGGRLMIKRNHRETLTRSE